MLPRFQKSGFDFAGAPLHDRQGHTLGVLGGCNSLFGKTRLFGTTTSVLPQSASASLATGQIGTGTLELNFNKKVKLQLKKKIRKTHIYCFYFDQKFCNKRIIDCEQK